MSSGRAERERLARLVLPLATFGVVVGLWQAGVIHRVLRLEDYTLAYPSGIVDTVTAQHAALWHHTAVTLLEAGAGYAIGAAGGFLLAVLLAEFPLWRQSLLPLVSGLVSMPIIALAPLMTLYFGQGGSSKVAVAAIMTLPTMAVTACKGLSSIDQDSADLLRALAASRRQALRRLRLPSALPLVFAALKLNVSLSLIGVIVAEFFGADAGLGSQMSYALETFDMPVAWTTILIAAAAGILWYRLVAVAERLSIPWHRSFRREHADG